MDFAGTDSRVPAAINCPYNLTYSYTLYALKAVLAPSLPANEGIRRPIKVLAPEGSILNPRFPAPCAARGDSGSASDRCSHGERCQSPMPTRALAAASQFDNTMMGGNNPHTNRPFVNFQMISGGFPARPYCDGEEALPLGYNTGNVPIEIDEAADPVVIDRFEFVTDSAGVGKYRGGFGIRKDIRVLRPIAAPEQQQRSAQIPRLGAPRRWCRHGGRDTPEPRVQTTQISLERRLYGHLGRCGFDPRRRGGWVRRPAGACARGGCWRMFLMAWCPQPPPGRITGS